MHKLGWFDPKKQLPNSDDPVIVDIAETEDPALLICWIGDYVNGERERTWVSAVDYSDLPEYFTVVRWCYFDFNDDDFKRKDVE